jgi:hypothetical protein
MCAALQIIDLDMLDKVGSAKGVEELRVQLKQQVSLAVCCAVAWHPCYIFLNRNRKLDWMLKQNSHVVADQGW